MGAWLSRCGQCDATVEQHHWQLLPRAGERQPHPFVTGQEGPGRQGDENLQQAVVVERFGGRQTLWDGWRISFRPERQCASHVAAKLLKQTKVVRLRHAERPGHGVVLAFLRQQADKEGPRLPAVERLRPLRK